MSFVSALPAQRPLFTLLYTWKIASDAGSGVDAIACKEMFQRDISLAYDIISLFGIETSDVGIGLELIMKVLSDIGAGLDRTSLWKTYEEVYGVRVPFVRDGQIIEPEDHNLQVDAYYAIKRRLQELGII